MKTYMALMAIFIGLLGLAILNSRSGYDDTDDVENGVVSNMQLLTDYGTGCQYLSVRNAGITPRLNRDGTQVCK